MSSSGTWVKIADVSSIPDGVSSFRKMKKNIAVLKNDGSILKVFQDNCPHNPKIKISSDYILKEETITCRFHGACWKINNGETIKGPGGDGLLSFEYKIDSNNYLMVFLD